MRRHFQRAGGAHALRVVAALPAPGSPVPDRDRLLARLFRTECLQPRLPPLGRGQPDRIPQGGLRLNRIRKESPALDESARAGSPESPVTIGQPEAASMRTD